MMMNSAIMHMRRRILGMIGLLILHAAMLHAQTKDYGLWTTLGTEIDLGKWDIESDIELRTNDHAQQVDRWGYWFLYYNDTKYDDFQPRHRVYIFLQGKYKLGDFTISLRERLQRTTKDESKRIKESGKTDTYKINPDVAWRNRMKVEYNIPHFKINPAFSCETFYQLNNPDGNSFEKLRYTLALNYKLKKHHEFEVYGLIDKEINVTDPVVMYVAGIGYLYSF
jgi:hypothetical protein